jgi:hypothetical protein
LTEEQGEQQFSEKEATLREVEGTFHVLLRGYYLWLTIYIILGVATVILPGIAATGFVVPDTAKVLAGPGALSSAIFAFLKPNDCATAYDAAATTAWKDNFKR